MNRNHPDYGRYVVDQLREKKLRAGLAFMIFLEELPPYHFYHEFPDGMIKELRLCTITDEFKLVRILSDEEANTLRENLDLKPIK